MTEKNFIEDVNLPKLNTNMCNQCDKDIMLSEYSKAISRMKNNLSHGCDGITVARYKVFWSRVSKSVIDSYCEVYRVGTLSLTQ